MRVYRYIPLLIMLLVSLILTACGNLDNQLPVTVSPTRENGLTSLPPPAETIIPQDTLTVIPQISPSPEIPGVMLLSPDPAEDPVSFENIRFTLEQLAAADNLLLEVRTTMDREHLHEGTRLVVALPPDPGLETLAANAPQIQFLAIGIPGLQPSPNLSVISSWEETVGQVAFMAGYIAAVVTPEWRVGVISTGDTPEGLVARQSFQNGVVFFCGLCQQSHPPYHRYPLYAEASAGSGEAAWKAAVDELVSREVRTVYLAPGAGDETLMAYLADAGVYLIGSGPPPDELRDHWIASVRVDYVRALSDSWQALLAGEGGFTLPVSIVVEDINQELFSPGRQLLVENLLPDLLNGFIDTGEDPRNSQND